MKRRLGLHAAWLVAGTLSWSSLSSVSGQLLPPPKDGDIRAVYWELRNASEVWLTLEPKSAAGASAPMLTFTFQFPGKRPAAPPAQIEVRAFELNESQAFALRAFLERVLSDNPVRWPR